MAEKSRDPVHGKLRALKAAVLESARVGVTVTVIKTCRVHRPSWGPCGWIPLPPHSQSFCRACSQMHGEEVFPPPTEKPNYFTVPKSSCSLYFSLPGPAAPCARARTK